MKKILYIGNNLKQARTNISSIGILGPLLEREDYNLYYASSKTNKLLRLLDMIFSVCRYAKRLDIVLIDTYSTQNFYYALIVSQLCRLLKLPYFPILHGGNLEFRLKQSPKFSRLIFTHSKVNVAPSLFIKSVFESYSYFNIVSIPNAFDINNYPFNETHIETIKLLWVRSFSKIYNPKLAIHVLKALHNNGIQAELCMVGPDNDGSLKKIQQLAKRLNVSVTFTGKLPKKEWIALAKQYNIFINTTNFDNMPVSVIEAMALGLPIVSTNVGGMPFLINHQTDGLLVPPDDVSSMSEAIKQVINNPKASRSMALKARKKVEQFDWEVVKHQWFELLR